MCVYDIYIYIIHIYTYICMYVQNKMHMCIRITFGCGYSALMIVATNELLTLCKIKSAFHSYSNMESGYQRRC